MMLKIVMLLGVRSPQQVGEEGAASTMLVLPCPIQPPHGAIRVHAPGALPRLWKKVGPREHAIDD